MVQKKLQQAEARLKEAGSHAARVQELEQRAEVRVAWQAREHGQLMLRYPPVSGLPWCDAFTLLCWSLGG